MRCDTPFYHQIVGHIQQRLPKQRITRIQNLSYLIVGIIQARSACLPKIAQRIPLPILLTSVIQRLWRLLDNAYLDPVEWYHPFIKPILSSFAGGCLRLVMDRSFIRNRHNVLWMGICWQGRALPLCWMHLGHLQGNSNQKQRTLLLKKILPLLPKKTQIILLADREFQSTKLMGFVQKHKIDFIIRIKANVRFTLDCGQKHQLSQLSLTVARRKDFLGIQLTRNCKFPTNLVIFQDHGQKDPWYLATSLPPGQKVISHYRKRFGIEAMFSDTKRRGFQLHDTHLEDPKRVERLLLAVAIACLWVALTGARLLKKGYRRVLETTSRRRLSLFQLGLRFMQRQFTLNLCPYPLF